MTKPVDVEISVVPRRDTGAATLRVQTKGGRFWSLFMDPEETRRVRDQLNTIIKNTTTGVAE